ncbi:hypothetical protein BH10ACT7_BH10ACT7_17280 [soil metagenome]
MPQFDLPLTALREYRSHTPQPAHFDDFWERELDAIGSLPPQASYTEVDTERLAFATAMVGPTSTQ